MAPLKSSMRCFAVDQRGHGLSDKPDSDYGASGYSKDVLALIETLNAGPAVIVGHSLGARNGVVAATLRPDLVSAVVAIDFTPYIEVEVLDALASRVNAGDRTFASREEIEDYLHGRYAMMPPEAIRRRAYSAYQEITGGIPSAGIAAGDGANRDRSARGSGAGLQGGKSSGSGGARRGQQIRVRRRVGKDEEAAAGFARARGGGHRSLRQRRKARGGVTGDPGFRGQGALIMPSQPRLPHANHLAFREVA